MSRFARAVSDPVSPEPLKVAEGISGVHHYHLSRMPHSTMGLCGARTMATAVPLGAWGVATHPHEHYCERCTALLAER